MIIPILHTVHDGQTHHNPAYVIIFYDISHLLLGKWLIRLVPCVEWISQVTWLFGMRWG